MQATKEREATQLLTNVPEIKDASSSSSTLRFGAGLFKILMSRSSFKGDVEMTVALIVELVGYVE